MDKTLEDYSHSGSRAKTKNAVRFIKNKIVNPALRPFGAKVIPLNYGLRNWPSFFEHIKSKNFYPKTVVDVGVASGTDYLYEAFSESRLILIEPVIEFKNSLDQITKEYNTEYVLAAAGSNCGEITIHVTADLGGTSIFKCREYEYMDMKPRVVPMTTLDHIDQEKILEPPLLIKIDTQGAELEVLKGATSVLEKTDVLILETMLIEQYIGQPVFFDYITFMKQKGFVVYDIIGCSYTYLEQDLGFVDLVFVKEKGIFRQEQRWLGEHQTHLIEKDYRGIVRIE
jgi:FkbM family methyltransferase